MCAEIMLLRTVWSSRSNADLSSSSAIFELSKLYSKILKHSLRRLRPNFNAISLEVDAVAEYAFVAGKS
jgi:hypothetical protein